MLEHIWDREGVLTIRDREWALPPYLYSQQQHEKRGLTALKHTFDTHSAQMHACLSDMKNKA